MHRRVLYCHADGRGVRFVVCWCAVLPCQEQKMEVVFDACIFFSRRRSVDSAVYRSVYSVSAKLVKHKGGPKNQNDVAVCPEPRLEC